MLALVQFSHCGQSDQLSVADALALWSSWFLDIPPTGATGDTAVDLRLADAFRMLAYLADRTQQMAWLERELRDFSLSGPAQPSPYHTMLIQWWLAIFDDGD